MVMAYGVLPSNKEEEERNTQNTINILETEKYFYVSLTFYGFLILK